jgi:hypothetical protein
MDTRTSQLLGLLLEEHRALIREYLVAVGRGASPLSSAQMRGLVASVSVAIGTLLWVESGELDPGWITG